MSQRASQLFALCFIAVQLGQYDILYGLGEWISMTFYMGQGSGSVWHCLWVRGVDQYGIVYGLGEWISMAFYMGQGSESVWHSIWVRGVDQYGILYGLGEWISMALFMGQGVDPQSISSQLNQLWRNLFISLWKHPPLMNTYKSLQH